MDPRRWQQVKALFEAARARPPEEREAYLREHCSGDDEMRDEVRSLLAEDGADDGFIDAPALGAGFAIPAPEASETPAEAPPAATIGAYRLVRLIGRGGMGAVYEAQQENPHRLVAIKLLTRLGPDDRAGHERFQREVDALARLNHPGIAAILEAGRSDDGRDYLVMELVEGVTLHRYVREAAPPRRRRLDLFLCLCDAVNYAHQRGVIHRDLKPANVLVADRAGAAVPDVKILDFGLARLDDADVRRATMVTEVGSIMGTLPYMSPEQARGDAAAIDLRSDVYALGVILYELLCDRRPIDLPDGAVPEAVRAICDDAPARPGGIDRRLRGDLETILLTALEKDPARRYQSVAALADDVRRHLADEPIVARPASATYQLGKFVRRHTVPVALVAVLVALSLVFGVVGTVQAIRLGRANRFAADEAEQREQVLYCSRIARAQLLDEQRNLLSLREVLDACEPARRGWEWSWLARLADPAEEGWSISGEPARALHARGGVIRVATPAADNVVEIREAPTWSAVHRLEGLGAMPTAVRFSPDGSVLAAGDRAGTIRTWSATDGSARQRIDAFDGPVDVIWFGEEGRYLAAAGGRTGAASATDAVGSPRGAGLWSLADGGLRSRIELPDLVTALTVSPDARRLAIGVGDRRREDGAIEAWDFLPAPRRVHRATVSAPVSALTLRPGGDEVVIAARDRTVRLLDLATGTEIRQFVGHDRSATALELSPDGTHLATGDGTGTLMVWRIPEGSLVRAVTAHREVPWWIRFADDGDSLLTFSLDGDVRRWSYGAEGDVLRTARTIDPRVFAFGAGTTCAMFDHADRRVSVVDAVTGAIVHEVRFDNEMVAALAFDRSGSRLAIGVGPRIEIIRIGTSETVRLAGDDARTVTSLAWSRDGRRIAAGFADGGIDVSSADGAERTSLPARHRKAVKDLLFDAVDARLVAASEDRLITVWSLEDRSLLHELAGHTDFVQQIDLHPDGRRLLSGSADGTLRLWDLDTGAATGVLSGHEGAVLGSRWTPSGDRILSGGIDVSVMVWHPEQRQALLSLRWPGHYVSDVSMTDDGRVIMARSLAGWVRSWNIE